MTGLPGLTELRSLNKPGLSLITLVFTDATNVYFARQLVMERLLEVGANLPQGVTPVLGPVSTALGEVYQYTLERPDDGKRALTKDELLERRTVQDWVVRPLLRSIPGVAEINSTGGYVKQYQVLVDPNRLRYFKVSIGDVYQALARNNANSGGGVLPQGAGELSRARRRPDPRPRRHPLDRAEGDRRDAGLHPRRRRGHDRRGGARGRDDQGRLHRGRRRDRDDDPRRQREGGGGQSQGAGEGDQRPQHAARRAEDRALLRPLRARRRGALDGDQGAARGRVPGGGRAVPLPRRRALEHHRRRDARPDAAPHVHRDEPLRPVGEPDVARRARDRDRPDGRRLGGGDRARVREARRAPRRVARAGDPRGGARGRDAGDLRRRHHHPRVPAADDPAGHGRQDVRAARLHHRDRARDLARDLAHAVAGARLLPAQGRRRARHLADPDDQDAVPAAARLGARKREDGDRRGGRPLRRRRSRCFRSSAPRSFRR